MQPIDHIKMLEKYDQHSGRITQLEQYRAISEMKFEQYERSHDQLCKQLLATDIKFGISLDEIKKDQRKLLDDFSKREGERGAVRWMPVVIQIVVGLILISNFVKTP